MVVLNTGRDRLVVVSMGTVLVLLASHVEGVELDVVVVILLVEALAAGLLVVLGGLAELAGILLAVSANFVVVLAGVLVVL